MFSDLGWLGILACIYAFARLIHYAELRLEDKSNHPFLQKILITICFILWIISAPVSIIMGIINFVHCRRLEAKIRKECSADPSAHNYNNVSSIPVEILAVILLVALIAAAFRISNLEDNIESMEAQIEDLSYEYDRGYENGFFDGCESSISISTCWECGTHYDSSSVFNFGYGLCDDCGRSSLTNCQFCDSCTLAWKGSLFFAVCPDCMGKAVEMTDLEEYLFNFNENR